MQAKFVLCLWGLICPLVSAEHCFSNGACVAADETSLVQVRHVVRHGEELTSQKQSRTSEIDLTSELSGLQESGSISSAIEDVPLWEKALDATEEHVDASSESKLSKMDESVDEIIHPDAAATIPPLDAPPTAKEEAMLQVAVDETLPEEGPLELEEAGEFPAKAHTVDFLAESSESEELILTGEMKKELLSSGVSKKRYSVCVWHASEA